MRPAHGGGRGPRSGRWRRWGLAWLCAAGEQARAWHSDEVNFVQVSLHREEGAEPTFEVRPPPNQRLLLSLHPEPDRPQSAPQLVRRPLQVPEAARGFLPAPVSADTLESTRDSIHNKLVMAGVRMQDKCRTEARALEDDPKCTHGAKGRCLGLQEELLDCHRAGELVSALVWATEVQQMASGTIPRPEHVPLELVHALLGLRYWLYSPGPTWSFTTLDKDRSGTLTFPELAPTFGEELARLAADEGRALKVRLWKLMDADSSGAVSREELAAHLRAAVRLRELVPSIDEAGAMASTEDLLRDLRAVAKPPRKLQTRMPHWLPLLVVFLVASTAWLLHCMCSSRRRWTWDRATRAASAWRPIRWTEKK